ncbi:hypothetical protein HYALB_00004730 [Hymenoscyphus albidus]|uniref:Xaa-Pro aminopeptidase n=1 Tax=Hymenoscyphus albidus TaxID=595503 RepID=A0A9N9M0H7_9HELO|nr:hypothetical protein HYALB_00004730 [Hymenoscyphus albidus]
MGGIGDVVFKKVDDATDATEGTSIGPEKGDRFTVSFLLLLFFYIDIFMLKNVNNCCVAKLHARGVAKRLGVKDGLIYLSGLPSMTYEDSDQAVFFRQRRYFYYLSGLNTPDCFVTYHIKTDCLTAWIPPPNYGRSVLYNGQNPTPEEIFAISDFDSVAYNTELRGALSKYAHREPGKIYLLHDFQFSAILETITWPTGETTSLHSIGSRFDVNSLMPAMNLCRAIKSPYEIKCIRKACDVSALAHKNVLRALRQISNETHVEAIFHATCIFNHAKRQAYGVIAGSGTNASLLHYGTNDADFDQKQLMVLDAGCEWKNYSSDITRTFPLNGEWTPEAKEIYDLVDQMQRECIAMVKPGADYRIVDRHAHKVAVRGLMKLGILRNGTFQEIYEAGASTPFLPHGLGHYMGLEVHDVVETSSTSLLPHSHIHSPDFRASETTMPSYAPAILEVNHVLTVEPGIYFNRDAFERMYLKDPVLKKYINKEGLERYYPVGGVRIEDDILVVEGGNEVLSLVPKGEEALRIIREGGEGF